MSYRATKATSSNRATSAGYEVLSVTRERWQDRIDPVLSELAGRSRLRLRRHRALIGRSVIEFIGDDDHAYQFFSRNWNPERTGELPNAYCYYFTQFIDDSLLKRVDLAVLDPRLPQSMICPENGRAVILGTCDYSWVRQVCRRLVRDSAAQRIQTTSANTVERPTETWWPLDAACIEYQAGAGPTRGVALLGGLRSGKTVHGLSLSTSKLENGLIADDLVVVQVGSGKAEGGEAALWLPTHLAATFPHLVPFLATSPSEGLALNTDTQSELQKHRDAADFAHGVENGSFPEELVAHLTQDLANSPHGHALVDPRELLGANRFLEHAQLTNVIHLSCDENSNWILRAVPKDEFVARCLADQDVSSHDKPAVRTARTHTACLNSLLNNAEIIPALVNTRLPPAQTQFCLRSFLEGHCDAIRIISPTDSCRDDSLLRSMRLEMRPREQFARDFKDSSGIYQGYRKVTLVTIERSGERVEAVAFDPAGDGFSQIMAVWPGQIADFFARHAPLHVRELFTETKNSALSPGLF